MEELGWKYFTVAKAPSYATPPMSIELVFVKTIKNLRWVVLGGSNLIRIWVSAN